MTLRRKTLLIQIAFFVALLLLLDLTFTNVLRKSAKQLDRQRMEQNLARAVVSLNGEARALYEVSELWANSDITWEYMRGVNPSFADAYLDRNIITALGISSMIFFDNEYNVRLFKDYSATDDPSAPEREFQSIITDDPEASALLSEIPLSGIKGITISDGTPLFYSIQPIFNSEMDSERAGYLLMTKTISDKLIYRLSQNLSFNFAIVPVTEKERAETTGMPQVVLEDNRKSSVMNGRILIRDAGGQPAAWVTGVFQKEDISAAERQIQHMFLLFAAVGLLFGFIIDQIHKRMIWNRLARIHAELQVPREDITKLHITDEGQSDELAQLAQTMNDTLAYMDFKREHQQKLDDITIRVFEKFSQAGNRLCYKTLEDIATAFTPRDENFRASIVRMARTTSDFARRMKVGEEDCLYAYLGAMFSRIGLLGLPFSARRRKWELSPQDLQEYKKYPAFSREFLESVELLRPAAALPYAWKENWDGSGFPCGLSGNNIPVEARIFAVVNEWNELTRPWPGRKMPTGAEVEAKLRERAGTRLDPYLVEEFIKFINGTDRG